MPTTYKVWIEIEEIHDEPEEFIPDPAPESAGEFDTLAEATELRDRLLGVTVTLGPEVAQNADSLLAQSDIDFCKALAADPQP